MARPEIARYLNARLAYGPSFSSDGQRLAFLTNVTGVPQVWQVALPEELGEPLWPDQLTFATERVMDAQFSPAPGDNRLVYSRDVGGNENAQLFLLSADGSEVTHLTEGHEGAMHIPGEWSGDGEQIIFAANRRHPGLFDLYVQPLGGQARLVWENDRPGYLVNAQLSPDGKKAVVTRVYSSFRHELFEVDVVEATARRLVEADEDVRYPSSWYAPDGRSLYLNTDLGSDFVYVARLDLESGDVETLVALDHDCGSVSLSRDGELLAYVVNVEGADELRVLNLATGAVRSAPTISDAPGLLADARLQFSPDGKRLALSYISATRTADIYVWDLASDNMQPVTRSSHGGIPVDLFVAPKLVRYPTFDREDGGEVRQIPAWFYRPESDPGQRLPVIVLVHGGPEGQYRPGFHGMIQYFVHSGYAVLAPNVRGSVGYGKAYSHLDDVRKRMDSVADLAYAAYWLKDQPDIDAERLVVYGGSYGGFMVLSAMTTYPDLWAAGIDIVGISSLATFLENTSEYRRRHREAEYGSLEHDREFLERIAPINHVDQIAAPLMVIHGANDPRVPLSEAEQLVEAVRARDVPVEFLVFDDEGHGLIKLKNKLVAYPAIVAFLDKHLNE